MLIIMMMIVCTFGATRECWEQTNHDSWKKIVFEFTTSRVALAFQQPVS